MFKKVFFSFHYEHDSWRAGQVRNSGITKSSVTDAGFIDAVEWESIQRSGESGIKRWINDQMSGTSVTVVLIGEQTASRPWVRYEIQQSVARGNALLGVQIHNLKDRYQKTDLPGNNPFELFTLNDGSKLARYIPIYNWSLDNGYLNFGNWVRQAVIPPKS